MERAPPFDSMGAGANTDGRSDHLRVLIANERSDRLELLAAVVEGLGHTVVERSIHVNEVAEARLLLVTASVSGIRKPFCTFQRSQ